MGAKAKVPYFKNPETPHATSRAITAPTKKVTTKLFEPETEPKPAPTAPDIAAVQNIFLFITHQKLFTIKTFRAK